MINQQGAPALINQQGAPGAAIEAAFKPFHQALEGDGGNRAIDTIIGNLNAISNSLQLMAVNPIAGPTSHQYDPDSGCQSQEQRASTAETVLRHDAAGRRRVRGDVANSTYAQLAQAFNNQVYPPCRDLAAGRYPLVKGESKEVALADFGRLFGPNGYFDRFFSQNLAAYADTSKSRLDVASGQSCRSPDVT